MGGRIVGGGEKIWDGERGEGRGSFSVAGRPRIPAAISKKK